MKTALSLLFISCCIIAYPQNLALNMYADTVHAPFIYGVASGDPTTNSVQLWTYVEPSVLGQEVTWLVATDSLFTNVVASGNATADANNGNTVKPIATGLQPNTHYYYRFYAPGNSLSVTGRTLTAPDNATETIKFGIASCSSIFSGYFNGYRHMANDNSISAIIHLGDYIYDFVDENEQIRITTPFPTSPNNLTEWRERHKYYLMDPDLRLARQMHPWIQTWDNHDFEQNGPVGTRAFFEFTPVTQPIPTDSNRIYRKVSYGLADIFLIDLMSYRNAEEITPGNNSSLGLTQFGWLTQGLAASTAKWKIIGSPKMMTPWSVAGLEQVLGTNSPVLFTSSWDGFPVERQKLLEYIDSAKINNVVVLSGDSHFSQSADLPLNPNSGYDEATGQGSIAVEYLPTSISRGNFDEMGYPANLQDFIIGLIDGNNPNHIYTEIIQHGYGTLVVTPDSAEAEYIYCPILELTDDTVHAGRLVVEDGDNHWRRGGPDTNPNTIAEDLEEKIILYPNPANDALFVQLPKTFTNAEMLVYDNTGKLITAQTVSKLVERVSLEKHSTGIYSLLIRKGSQTVVKRFVKE